MTVIENQPLEISTIDCFFEPLIRDFQTLNAEAKAVHEALTNCLIGVAQKADDIKEHLSPYENAKNLGDLSQEDHRNALKEHFRTAREKIDTASRELQLISLYGPMIGDVEDKISKLVPRLEKAQDFEAIAEQGYSDNNQPNEQMFEYRNAHNKVQLHMALLNSEIASFNTIRRLTKQAIGGITCPADIPFDEFHDKTTVGAFVDKAALQIKSAEFDSGISNGTKRNIKAPARLRLK